MNCNLFRLVANRADFDSSWLQSPVPFTPVEASDAAARTRQFLKFDTADYFVEGPTMALIGTPALLHEFGIRHLLPSAVFQVTRRIRFQQPDGMKLVSDRNGVPRVWRRVAEWPVSLEMKLQFVDRSSVRCVSGGLSEIVPAKVSNSKLYVTWPTFSGITGALQLDQPSEWKSGSEAIMTVEPSNYPAEAVLEALGKTSFLTSLLEAAGLLSAFGAAPLEPGEQLGMVGMALALDTLSRQ